MTSYLEKSALFQPQIDDQPNPDLNMVVVIPAYDESHLIRSLVSLKNCESTLCSVEVIVVFNASEIDSTEVKQNNSQSFVKALGWSKIYSTPKIKFHILNHSDLPSKKAGVGMARKIGMDEAVYRLEETLHSKGIIACFDADSLCQPNYLKAIENHFLENPNTQACSIYFEHPLEGEEHETAIYEAIILYELHLRYYNNAKRFSGFPYAFETIGSSMAVRFDAYQQQGGMNERKAGEDFYFLNKFMPLGNFTEIRNTMVIPSPRKSDRVPFGTGKAIAEIVEGQKEFLTYSPQTFIDLKRFFDMVLILYSKTESEIEELLSSLPESVQSFLESQDFILKLSEIKSNTTNLKTFYNRFFRWFNGFLMMKYVHHTRDRFYPNVSVEKAAWWLLKNYYKLEIQEGATTKDLLKMLRQEDKK